eukprot:4538213-Lingulodinium_polyedra.AAC.1
MHGAARGGTMFAICGAMLCRATLQTCVHPAGRAEPAPKKHVNSIRAAPTQRQSSTSQCVYT